MNRTNAKTQTHFKDEAADEEHVCIRILLDWTVWTTLKADVRHVDSV